MSEVEKSALEVDANPILDANMMYDFSEKGNEPDLEELDMPDEIRSVFDQFDISKRKFTVILKEITGSAETDSAYVKSWTKQIPSFEYIALEYGPGEYAMHFTWRSSAKEEGPRNRNERIFFTIGENRRDDHDDYILEKRMKKSKSTVRKAQREKMRSTIEGAILGNDAPQQHQDLKSQFQEFAQTAAIMGYKVGGQNDGPKVDWASLLSAIGPLIPSILGALNEASRSRNEMMDKMMLMMMNQNQSSSNQMVEMLKIQKPQGGGDNFREAMGLLMEVADFKKAMNPEKEGVVDKIFGMLEKVAPQVGNMMLMGQQQRQKSIEMQMAKGFVNNSPDFQKAKEDPEMLNEIIRRTDASFGWEHTDVLLNEVWGAPRDVSVCPRKPQERYPQGDERNYGEAVETPTNESEVPDANVSPTTQES